ncbi:MAG TPA: chromate transporter [Myxococcales bacterium]|nr:chromate transporter [Myxococcales bacterium]
MPPKVSHLALFLAFSEMALSGFGGVLPFAYRTLVERRRWLTPEEFTKLLAVSQVMPGPTICNLSVMYGYRVGGIGGSAAALGGMIALPMTIVLGLGVAWHEFGAVPPVRRALTGMSAVVAGLILATAMKMSRAVPRHAIPIALSVASFVGVGLLRFPLLAVIVFVAPVGIVLAWREHW